jgi:hypothetical protein
MPAVASLQDAGGVASRRHREHGRPWPRREGIGAPLVQHVRFELASGEATCAADVTPGPRLAVKSSQ